jgi:hypothetical protein
MRLKIDIAIFRWTVYVHFISDPAQTYARLSGKADDVADAEAITYTDRSTLTTHIILRREPSCEAIAHEVMHTADDLLSTCGIHLCSGTEEVYAYTVGYISGRIHRYIHRHDIGIKM